ncbi:MAG: pyridoxal-dependent decarboxylase, exosortase A system-associated [Telluria sp.]
MTVHFPSHAPQHQFNVENDELHIGGIPLRRLAARVGRTPFYAYDRGVLTATAQRLRASLPAAVHIHYALKANPMPALVQHMATLVDGFDVASAQELRVALDTGMDPAAVSFAGPGKGDGELACAIAAGVVLNAESAAELERAARAGAALGIRPKVALRINPDFELKSSGMKMGGGARQFGIDAEEAPAVLRRMASLDLDFEGLHIFCGSQNLRPDALIEAHARTFALAGRLAQAAPAPMRTLNIGGGFGLPYFAGETWLDVAAIGAHLAEQLPRVDAQVVLEFGRYLAGPAGVYVCRVVERKLSRGQVFLVTDGGLHHHLAASGNFGQVIRKDYPVAIGTRVSGGERETASVVGPLCTPLDVLADRVELARARPGDLVAVFQSGAYGLTASPAAFLGHPGAVEVLV